MCVLDVRLFFCSICCRVFFFFFGKDSKPFVGQGWFVVSVWGLFVVFMFMKVINVIQLTSLSFLKF